MIGNRQQLARMQSDFYRDCYHKCLRLLLVEVVVMLILIVAIVTVIYRTPTPPYYASSTTGQIINLSPASN